MRLWSFQSSIAIKHLQNKGQLKGDWKYVSKGYWTKSYKWMAEEMKKRGLDCEGNPPVWAWHSCGAWERPPTLNDARALLSDGELELGVQVVEFEVAEEWVLLSRYSVWNLILDAFIDNNKEFILKNTEHLFVYNKINFPNTDSIQATLPILKTEWVTAIRPLKLQPGDFDFDPKEKV